MARGQRAPRPGSLALVLAALERCGIRAEAEARACTAGSEGSCIAHGAGRQWWLGDGVKFSSKHVLDINTLSFNKTLSDAKHRHLLVAFYDPRSQSFKDLKAELDEVADALAGFEEAGAPIGRLGACDVTVHTYLGSLQAPEMSHGWQDSNDGVFRFGRPRFFPLILIFYKDGERVGEYTGVVNAKHMTAFLQRQIAVKGGPVLGDAAAVSSFLEAAGPFAVGCGFVNGSAEQTAFRATTEDLHGELIFGWAAGDACMEAFGGLPASWPQVIWSDGGKHRSLTDAALLPNATELGWWLRGQRSEVLEEMTPDTSYKYLEGPEPLVIFLVDPRNASAWESGVSVLAGLEQRLHAVHLVWSDCRTFGAQFSVRGMCPVFVAVDPETMLWRKISVRALHRRAASSVAPSGNVSMQFLGWLKNVTGLPLNFTGRRLVRSRVNDSGDNEDKGYREAPDDSTDAEQSEEDFLESLPNLGMNFSGEPLRIFSYYHAALNHLSQLQVSYEASYGVHLPFDFSDLRKAQKLHRSMQMLAWSPASVQRQVQEPRRLKALWESIEWSASFQQNMSQNSFKPGAADRYAALAMRGYNLVRGVFRRLFQHLHGHAARGSLGRPEASERPVERRAASGLSVREFVDRYARPGLPVIITGLNITEEEPWTLEFFKRRCNVSAKYLRKNVSRKSWGRLEPAGTLPLPEFVDSFMSNGSRRKWYLHDWSLPRHCPDVFGPPPFRSFTVPKYFAGDYFQRAAFDGYQHTWPSLFIGSNETQSAMHVDSGGTNFWLYLLSGQKEWRFYSSRDLVNVYKSPLHEHFLFDAFSPDPVRFPLLRYAETYVGVQEAGDLVFIPGGNPHAVRNLEHIHGVSMNYVDLSNVWTHLWHALASQSFQTFELFTDGASVPHGLRSEQEALRFGEWKSARWKELTYDLN